MFALFDFYTRTVISICYRPQVQFIMLCEAQKCVGLFGAPQKSVSPNENIDQIFLPQRIQF
jgi:hypothetical protein